MAKQALTLIFIAVSLSSFAWPHESYIKASLNIGATSPYHLPQHITASGYNPIFSPSISYEISVYRNNSFKLFTGLRYEVKGMHVKAKVQNYYTEFYQDDSRLTGYFTGKNDTKANNSYITLPIKCIYEFNNKWSIYGGGYASYLTSSKFKGYAQDGYIWVNNNTNKIIVTKGEFDFSKNIRSWDIGAEMGAKRMINNRLGVDLNVTAGLLPIFGNSFKSITFNMYNIFIGIGVSYKL